MPAVQWRAKSTAGLEQYFRDTNAKQISAILKDELQFLCEQRQLPPPFGTKNDMALRLKARAEGLVAGPAGGNQPQQAAPQVQQPLPMAPVAVVQQPVQAARAAVRQPAEEVLPATPARASANVRTDEHRQRAARPMEVEETAEHVHLRKSSLAEKQDVPQGSPSSASTGDFRFARPATSSSSTWSVLRPTTPTQHSKGESSSQAPSYVMCKDTAEQLVQRMMRELPADLFEKQVGRDVQDAMEKIIKAGLEATARARAASDE